MVYLHPYDLDPDAEPLAYPKSGYTGKKMGDKMRRMGRVSAAAKLEALAKDYAFESLSA
jgi:hypothetical protein